MNNMTILIRQSNSTANEPSFIDLFKGNLVPAYVILASLACAIYHYLLTLDDEVQLIWSQKKNSSNILFLFVRYYTICVILLNAIQIHLFMHKGYATDTSCVAFYIFLRIAGGIAVWAVEIIMQYRVYALFGCSRQVAIFNALVFLCSILASLGIIIYNGVLRQELIASAIRLPLPGCPDINGGIQWAEWVPTTIYELILCSFALFKLFQQRDDYRAVLSFKILVNDNVLYFFGITFILVFNDLMVAGQTHIPWFSFGPFYALLGIMTSQMVFHLLQSQRSEVDFDDPTAVADSDFNKTAVSPIAFAPNLSDEPPSNV